MNKKLYERTSKGIASIAGKLLRTHDDEDVLKVAASALAQRAIIISKLCNCDKITPEVMTALCDEIYKISKYEDVTPEMIVEMAEGQINRVKADAILKERRRQNR